MDGHNDDKEEEKVEEEGERRRGRGQRGGERDDDGDDGRGAEGTWSTMKASASVVGRRLGERGGVEVRTMSNCHRRTRGRKPVCLWFHPRPPVTIMPAAAVVAAGYAGATGAFLSGFLNDEQLTNYCSLLQLP